MSDHTSIRSIIGRVREGVRQVTDDSIFSDEYIYVKCLDIRKLLMYRELNKKKHTSPFTYSTFCIPLELSSEIPCDCIPSHLNCRALKSTHKIPKPVNNENYDMISVLSLDGRKEIGHKTLRAGKANKYSRLGTDRPFYDILNEYVYVVGYPNNKLKAVQIQMIPEDPSEIADLNICTGDCGRVVPADQECYDFLDDSFNIEGHLVAVLVDEAIKSLTTSLSVPENITNDTVATDKNI